MSKVHIYARVQLEASPEAVSEIRQACASLNAALESAGAGAGADAVRYVVEEDGMIADPPPAELPVDVPVVDLQ